MHQTARVAVIRLVTGNRVTLPTKVTSRLGVGVGDELLLVERENGWLLTPPTAEVSPQPLDN